MKNTFYYQDAYRQTFSAEIVHSSQDKQGPYIVLSNTAFYPTGGGQPHDTGWIEDVEIINVENIEGEIRHYTAEPTALTGTVSAKINWARRFDHMQQHAGQHILTAAFVELFGYQTVSFHLGTEIVTIDLDTPAITEEQLLAAQARANDIILENRPIDTKWVTKDELSTYTLRKDVAVEGDIRLVIIPDYDYNGCGGTHPSSTGQVQLIQILETEKMKGGIRVHFVCGKRITEQLAMRKEVLSDVARQLSVPEREAASALEKVMVAAKQTDKALADARESLLQFEAKELVAQGETIIASVFEKRTIQELQKLARFITQENPDTMALLVANNADKLQFVAARGADVKTSMKTISTSVLPLINGKGGGNDALVQGGGDHIIAASDLLAHMQAVL